MRRIVLVSVVGFSLACSGIGDSLQSQIEAKIAEGVAEAVVEAGADQHVEIDGDEIVVTTPEGTVTVGGDGAVQPDWPTDVPLYPGLKVVASATGAAAAGGAAITAESGDDVAKVMAFYAEQMTGWTVALDANTRQGQMRSYASADGKRTVQLIVAPQGTGSSVSVVVSGAP